MVIQHDETLTVQLFAALRDHNSSMLGTVLGTLILTDFDINAPGESGHTALEAAFAWECPDEMRCMLIEAGADASRVKDQIGWAARSAPPVVLEIILDAGADPNGRSTLWDGPGVVDEVSDVFNLMFGEKAQGGGAHPALYTDATPLIIAAGEGRPDVIKLLLERGADIGATDAEGRTAFDVAQEHRQMTCVIALLDGGADPHNEAPTGEGLLRAAANGDVLKLRGMVRRGLDLEVRDSRRSTEGYTALMLAAARGHATVVTVLLGAGANPEAHNRDQWTALHLAAANSQRKAAQALIGGGAACDPKNAAGETPLMLAVAEDAVEVISDLIVAGADPQATDSSGNDAAHRVRQLLDAVPTASPRRRKKATKKKGAKKKATKKKVRKKTTKKKATRKKAPRKKVTRKGAKKRTAKKATGRKVGKKKARARRS